MEITLTRCVILVEEGLKCLLFLCCWFKLLNSDFAGQRNEPVLYNYYYFKCKPHYGEGKKQQHCNIGEKSIYLILENSLLQMNNGAQIKISQRSLLPIIIKHKKKGENSQLCLEFRWGIYKKKCGICLVYIPYISWDLCIRPSRSNLSQNVRDMLSPGEQDSESQK